MLLRVLRARASGTSAILGQQQRQLGSGSLPGGLLAPSSSALCAPRQRAGVAGEPSSRLAMSSSSPAAAAAASASASSASSAQGGDGGPSTAAAAPSSPSSNPPAAVTDRAQRPAPPLSQSRFCRQCAGSMRVARPEGDSEYRHICGDCGAVEYANPKFVVGCIVEHSGKLLLCRRAIEPCKGLWTTPAGFLEIGEASAAGAERETWEEAGARVDILQPFAHFDIPAIGQSYLLFRARLAAPFTHAESTPESLEVRMFTPDEVRGLAGSGGLAFSSVRLALEAYCDDLEAGGRSTYRHGTIVKAPGSAPNDPGTFRLENCFAFELAPVGGAVGGGGAGGES